ncbi:MAG: hypothetical protein ABF296_00570, partial [Oceanococcaceae bacterium]
MSATMVSMNHTLSTRPATTPPGAALAGASDFTGQLLHAADITDEHVLGQRVGLIGTGARAILLLPRLVAEAQKVTVFQRTPRWILPSWPFGRVNPLSPAPEAYTGKPLLRAWAQQRARMHLKRSISERWLRRQLTPQEPFSARPALISAEWYALLQQPSVKLITWPIIRLCP